MEKPNFTGTWIFNPAKSRLQITPPDETTFMIQHNEPLFRLSRTHVVGGKADTLDLDLSTDGNEVELDMGGLHIRSRLHWEEETLVFDSHLRRGDEEATNLVRYTLAATLGEFVAEERFRSKTLSYDNLWVFDRE
jgi:hypothetical protein